MNAKPDNLPPADTLAETVDFLAPAPGPRRGPDGGVGGHGGGPDAGGSRGAEGRHRYTFATGSRPHEGYTIRRAIGRGGFGEVYYATSDSGKEVALKLITRNLEIERRGVVQCMNLKCPNLLAIHDIKGNDAGDTFVIMEYVAGPNLAQVLADYPAGMPPAEVRAWLRGLVEGVAYLHDHGIVHRDLKPANLFMEEGVVKIGDYGLSKMITSERVSNHSESIGTCHYMAPEISTGKYNKPIDVYAIGVILYEMLVGRVPFDGETVGEVLIKHLTTRPDLSVLPEPYRAVVAQALAKDPAHRPARVLDLLPPGDAPAAREVRFIGDGRAPAPAPRPRPAPAPAAAFEARAAAPPRPDDDILRIGDEEPILYIGPDTRPPEPPARVADWRTRRDERRARCRQRRDERRERRAARWHAPSPIEAVSRAATRVRLVADAARPSPAPIEPPPPPPAGRALAGELSGALCAAACWSALGAVLAGALIDINVAERPQDVGFLFAATTLASWAALAGGKLAEGRAVGDRARRAGQFALGGLLGLGMQLLGSWLMVDPGAPALGVPESVGCAAFFGIVGLGVDWWRLAERDRRSRFRVGPVFKAGLVSLIPTLAFYPAATHPLAIPVVLLTAIVVQASAPWSEAAALYAQAARFGRRWSA